MTGDTLCRESITRVCLQDDANEEVAIRYKHDDHSGASSNCPVSISSSS